MTTGRECISALVLTLVRSLEPVLQPRDPVVDRGVGGEIGAQTRRSGRAVEPLEPREQSQCAAGVERGGPRQEGAERVRLEFLVPRIPPLQPLEADPLQPGRDGAASGAIIEAAA